MVLKFLIITQQKSMNDFHKWKLKECFVEIRSPGLAFIGERWFDRAIEK